MDLFRFYFGRLLQLSGFALTGYVVVLFFNPLNKEAKLLLTTLVGIGLFAAGHLLLRSRT